MNVLITGGAGFIGSHLAAHHLELNDSVYVVDDFSAGRMENINPFLSNPNFKFEKADLCFWRHLPEIVWSQGLPRRCSECRVSLKKEGYSHQIIPGS